MAGSAAPNLGPHIEALCFTQEVSDETSGLARNPSAKNFTAFPRRIMAGSNFIPVNKKRHRLPQARPRIVDRIQLAMSIGRHLDGIWIGSWRGRPEDLTRVEGALLLIKQHSPLDYARIARELERIWVSLSFHGLGEYKHSLRGLHPRRAIRGRPRDDCRADRVNDCARSHARKARTIRD